MMDQNNNKTILIYLSVLIILLLGANLWYLVSNNNKWGDVFNFDKDEPVITSEPLAVQDRLEITSPTSNTVISKEGGILLIEGKMQGFFEGTLNFRIVDDKGNAIFEDNVVAVEDNYGQMAKFSKEVLIDTEQAEILSSSIDLVFYEVSMKDGSETELLTITLPVEN